MGQLMVKFRENNPIESTMEFKLSLPPEVEKKLNPKEVIINEVAFEEKETQTPHKEW